MAGSQDRNAGAGTEFPKPAIYAIVGLLLGFAIIHPATMLMNHHMAGPPHHPEGWTVTVMEALRGAFATAHGWMWGSGYALMSALIGFLMGALKARELALQAANTELSAEKERSDGLLLNILPQKVADELKESGQSPPPCPSPSPFLHGQYSTKLQVQDSLTPA